MRHHQKLPIRRKADRTRIRRDIDGVLDVVAREGYDVDAAAAEVCDIQDTAGFVQGEIGSVSPDRHEGAETARSRDGCGLEQHGCKQGQVPTGPFASNIWNLFHRLATP